MLRATYPILAVCGWNVEKVLLQVEGNLESPLVSRVASDGDEIEDDGDVTGERTQNGMPKSILGVLDGSERSRREMEEGRRVVFFKVEGDLFK